MYQIFYLGWLSHEIDRCCMREIISLLQEDILYVPGVDPPTMAICIPNRMFADAFFVPARNLRGNLEIRVDGSTFCDSLSISLEGAPFPP